MLRGERLHTVEREEQLEIHRLLAPERAVVIERGNALLGRDKIRRAFLGDLGDEVSDRLLRCAVIPRWKRIGGGPSDGRCESQRAHEHGGDEVLSVPGFHCCVLSNADWFFKLNLS